MRCSAQCLLNNRLRIIAVRELFQGTIDGASIHPRVVVQQALALNAAALVVFHNIQVALLNPVTQTRLSLNG